MYSTPVGCGGTPAIGVQQLGAGGDELFRCRSACPTFCGGGRLRSPEQEQWLQRACTAGVIVPAQQQGDRAVVSSEKGPEKAALPPTAWWDFVLC